MTAKHVTQVRGISFVNAELGIAGASSLRVVGSTIQAIGERPMRGDLIVNLEGDRLMPGLINAHDHLQLNGFAPLRYRDRYTNVCEWISDVASRKSADPELLACLRVPHRTRQVHGGLKNILSGVTTVAHHDPLHEGLLGDGFPVRVVEKFGWSHSLGVDGILGVQGSFQDTPPDWPWVIHAAEGVDDDAAHEFTRLESLGCIAANTLIVHGVAMDTMQQQRLVAAGAGLIWCPTSNAHLFGTTLDVARLVSARSVALGTDSRMTGERDLLSELSVARRTSQLDSCALEAMVTSDAARLLRLEDRGTLSPGRLADILVLPAGTALHQAARADVRLVMLDGQIRIGDARYVRLLGAAAHWAEIELDGHTKLMDRALATLIQTLGVREPGLQVRASAWRAA